MSVNVFFGHQTAIEYWVRLALEEAPRGIDRPPVALRLDAWGLRHARIGSLADRAPTDVELVGVLEAELPSLPRPAHVLVGPNDGRLRPTAAKVCHSWARLVPPGAFVRLAPHVYMSTPEFAFLQMARGRSPVSTLRLAYELCGTFLRSPFDERGFRDIVPLTSVERLRALAAGVARGGRGGERLLRLLSYVGNRSASPMEEATAIRLFTPRTWGSYGARVAELNGRIDLPADPARFDPLAYYKCDFLWRRERLAVEYDSDFHTGAERISRDAERRDKLASLGYTVLTITKRQFFDSRLFREAAERICGALGMRADNRPHRYDWLSRFYALQKSVLVPEDRLTRDL